MELPVLSKNIDDENYEINGFSTHDLQQLTPLSNSQCYTIS